MISIGPVTWTPGRMGSPSGSIPSQGLKAAVLDGPDYAEVVPTLHHHELRVATRDDEPQEGGGDIRVAQAVGEEVGGQVVHPHEGHVQGHAEPFGIGNPHHQGADEAGAVRGPHEPDLPPFGPRLP